MVCGGTLGIFLAAALQLAGLRVAVVERGPLRGRAQEWNISRKEIAELVGSCQIKVASCVVVTSEPRNPNIDKHRECCDWQHDSQSQHAAHPRCSVNWLVSVVNSVHQEAMSWR